MSLRFRIDGNEAIVQWLDNTVPTPDDVAHALGASYSETRFVQPFNAHLETRPEDESDDSSEQQYDGQTSRGVRREDMYEAAYYETLERQYDEQISREMAFEALFEEAYYETLERQYDEQISREMAFEALFEEAYYDLLEGKKKQEE
jgi:hypothetical protein